MHLSKKEAFYFLEFHFLKFMWWLLADESRQVVAIPVVPVVGSETKNILIFQEGKAVLPVPVIGLIPHPVKPLYFSSTVIPCPVSKVVIPMRSLHMGSNPPLAFPLHPSISKTTHTIRIRDQRLQQIVLRRATTLVHVNQPSSVELAQDSCIIISHPLL